MAKEKKETKKTVAKASTKNKIVSKKNTKVQSNTQSSAPVFKEDVYPAINIANIYGLSDFAFYMIKNEKNINDGTLMTMSEFERYMKEVIRR